MGINIGNLDIIFIQKEKEKKKYTLWVNILLYQLFRLEKTILD
jgi:hypothetical protein